MSSHLPVYNFCAGPGIIDHEILQQAAQEMCDYQNTGLSIMEMSHRGSHFTHVLENLESLVRELLDIPEDYGVLFLQGGATAQFALIPMNFTSTNDASVCYVDTGVWAKKALSYAQGLVTSVDVIQNSSYTQLPEIPFETLPESLQYLHITSNNTIWGTQFRELPQSPIPLISDMSSCIFSEPIDVRRYACIYAGAQKNIGPAGFCLVIYKRDLLQPRPDLPPIFNYKAHDEAGSRLNTPPCYSLYIAQLVLERLKSRGGVAKAYEHNLEKARILYDFLDQSSLFRCHTYPEHRSLMNVPFSTQDDELDSVFLQQAEEHGLLNLKGHRSTLGIRASLYNAMPTSGVHALVDFMGSFEQRHSHKVSHV